MELTLTYKFRGQPTVAVKTVNNYLHHLPPCCYNGIHMLIMHFHRYFPHHLAFEAYPEELCLRILRTVELHPAIVAAIPSPQTTALGIERAAGNENQNMSFCRKKISRCGRFWDIECAFGQI